ncbi:MATE family efflux transporter [Clostridium paraputrificum]|uniref:MATE family efflux transporter n=1 Tax=Clostridium TaxID=1485 RepID=UPI0018A0392D|nr:MULTISPECIES: MATE family efflux transporter [Clostridium]MDB2076094.1 MATE family efflux transporter [Clostridium paraputrificum]MDB2079448.1 MATE family efflux transporter [Clostridium paraputrificum]MDB2084373.1 MATE family efflux transporter [Clostridium paraputrificum]MDB2098885.1 MATE family efflux transporter [Clostridium paraputrificum]MDU5739637.1 MATE family efflux transporter [Clostridium sp.]
MKNKSQFKEFARYSTLNVLGMIGLSCYILADTFFVSRGLGENGLTALNLAIPVYSFIHGSGLMLGIGGATKYSIFKSNKENKNANTIFTNTLCLATVLSIGFVLIGIFLSKSLTTALGADSDVFKMTNTYLQFILIFAPAFIINDVLICFVRNDNSPKLSMYAMLGGSLSNIILDYIFIFPLQLGIFGAVFATGLAPIISMLILSLHRIKRKNQFHFIKIKPSIKIARNTLSLGFPSLVTEVSSGIVIIVFNMIILNLIGNVGVAAYGIVANLSLVVVAVYTGIAQGIQPLISKSYGGNDIKSIKLIFKYAMITMSIISFILYLIIFFLADPIAKIFNSENNLVLQSIATNGLKLYFMAVIFVGFNIILPMLFSSMEKAFLAQIISLLRGLVVIIPMAFILSALVGLTGVWLAFPITESLVSILGVILYLKLRI